MAVVNIMEIKRRYGITVFLMVLQAAGMLLFASRFFSVDDTILSPEEVTQVRLSVLSGKTLDLLTRLESHCNDHARRKVVDKAVIIVIDALRADFIPSIVNSSISRNSNLSMPFLESLMKQRKAIGLVSEAQTPTVTLPRIKAILSGTYPSFLDIVKNLNAPRFGEDNFLTRLFKRGDRVLFYGDETWLSMFPPSSFVRFNGTSSFFATDYTSVDVNVTENALPELSRLKEWDVMILHYLGVDHIGHSHGGSSSKILPVKLLEMDSIIQTVDQFLIHGGESYAVIITGDHGMTDAGNHGGNSQEESDTAAVFFKTPPSSRYSTTHLKQRRIMQVDLAVTISSLLGLATPVKSKGVISVPVLKHMDVDPDHLLCLLHNNALHLQKMKVPVVTSEINSLSKAISTHMEYITLKSSDPSSSDTQKLFSTSTKYYSVYAERIQHAILSEKSRTSSSTFSWLSLSVLESFAVCFALLLLEVKESQSEPKSRLNHHRSQILNQPGLSQPGYSILTSICGFTEGPDPISMIFFSHFILHSFLLGSTSFIEMENYYWSFMASSLVLFHCIFVILRKMFIRQRSSAVSHHEIHDRNNYLDHGIVIKGSIKGTHTLNGDWTSISLSGRGANTRNRKLTTDAVVTNSRTTGEEEMPSPLNSRTRSKRGMMITTTEKGSMRTSATADVDANRCQQTSGSLSASTVNECLEKGKGIQEDRSVNVLSEGTRRDIQRLYLDSFFLTRPVIYLLVLVLLRITSCWFSVENEATLSLKSDDSSTVSSHSFRDIRSYLQAEDHKHLLSSLVILTFVSLTFLTPSTRIGKQHCLLGSGFFWVYLFRSDCTGSNKVLGFNTKILSDVGLDFSMSPNTKARLVYIHIILIILDSVAQRLKLDTKCLYLYDFIRKYTDRHQSSYQRDQIRKLSCLRVLSTCHVLVSCLLLRVEFIPLFGLNILLEKLVHHCVVQESSSKKILHHLIAMYITLAFSAFYCQGNSNSISSIDTSSGYIGLESFNLILVTLLVTLSTFAGFIYWILMLFVRVQESKSLIHPELKERQMRSLVHSLLLQRYWTSAVFQVVCLILQNHLFIWSVISPKLLHEVFITILFDVLLVFLFTMFALDQNI